VVVRDRRRVDAAGTGCIWAPPPSTLRPSARCCSPAASGWPRPRPACGPNGCSPP
jgi:hypothetical protein